MSKPAKDSASKAPPPPLPKSLVQALPASSTIMKHISAVEMLIPALRKEMVEAKKNGAIPLARAFTVLHRLVSTIDSKLQPLSALFEEYKTIECPAAFEQSGITSVPLTEGYRVGISYTLRASIKAEMKTDAYKWLQQNQLGDIITETVNSSTLSATARTLLEDQNKELPDKLFNVANVPNTSVTRT